MARAIGLRVAEATTKNVLSELRSIVEILFYEAEVWARHPSSELATPSKQPHGTEVEGDGWNPPERGWSSGAQANFGARAHARVTEGRADSSQKHHQSRSSCRRKKRTRSNRMAGTPGEGL